MKIDLFIKEDFAKAGEEYSLFLLTYFRFQNNLLQHFKSELKMKHKTIELLLYSSLQYVHLLHSHIVLRDILLETHFITYPKSSISGDLASTIQELHYSLRQFPFSSDQIKAFCLITIKQIKNYYAPDSIKVIIPASAKSLPWLAIKVHNEYFD